MSNIKSQLKEIGVLPYMSLEIHSSYKKIGLDITPEEFIQELEEYITHEGNIVMSTFPLSKKLPLDENDIKLGISTKSKWLSENHNERTDMGIIADKFRLSNNVLTGNGQHRMSAWGKSSIEIVSDLNYLINNNGYTLLIGVDILKLTAMHYVEHCIPNDVWPLLFSPINPEIEKKYDMNEYFITSEGILKYLKGWLHIQSIAESNGFIKHGKIGNADCMFFNIKKVISIYENEIKTNLNSLFNIDFHPTTAST